MKIAATIAPMRILDSYILRLFLPIFLIALLFFILILELISLFVDLVRYIELQTPLASLLELQLLYLPRSISFALPIAVLFACSFTVGSLYGSNQMIAIFGSGIPLYRFVMPLLLCGLLISIFSFWFEEALTINASYQHEQSRQRLLSTNQTFSNNTVAALSPEGIIYYTDFYDDAAQSLTGAIIIIRSDGVIVQRIDAEEATWNGTHWRLHDVRIYNWNSTGELWQASQQFRLLDAPQLTLEPKTFQRALLDVEDMQLQEAREYIASLRSAGLPYRRELTTFYRRFSFALTPFMVVFVSSAVGGRFRKNILLMSMLISLCLSVSYYVIGLVSDVMASNNLVEPLLAAWFNVGLFLLIGVGLFVYSRT